MKTTENMSVKRSQMVDVSGGYAVMVADEVGAILLRQAEGFETRKIRVENLTPYSETARAVPVRYVTAEAVTKVEHLLSLPFLPKEYLEKLERIERLLIG